jgi:hypothetical protein
MACLFLYAVCKLVILNIASINLVVVYLYIWMLDILVFVVCGCYYCC